MMGEEFKIWKLNDLKTWEPECGRDSRDEGECMLLLEGREFTV